MDKVYLNGILNTEDEKKIIKTAKKLAGVYRKLPEYSIWAYRCKEGKFECENCGIEFIEDVIEPEVHHTPSTLTDIIYNVIVELLEKEENFTSIDVLSKVNEMHYNDEVMYAVLCECCHNREHKARKKK